MLVARVIGWATTFTISDAEGNTGLIVRTEDWGLGRGRGKGREMCLVVVVTKVGDTVRGGC